MFQLLLLLFWLLPMQVCTTYHYDNQTWPSIQVHGCDFVIWQIPTCMCHYHAPHLLLLICALSIHICCLLLASYPGLLTPAFVTDKHWGEGLGYCNIYSIQNVILFKHNNFTTNIIILWNIQYVMMSAKVRTCLDWPKSQDKTHLQYIGGVWQLLNILWTCMSVDAHICI